MVIRCQFLYLLTGSAATSSLSACGPGTVIGTPTATLTSQPDLPTATAVFTPISQTDATPPSKTNGK